MYDIHSTSMYTVHELKVMKHDCFNTFLTVATNLKIMVYHAQVEKFNRNNKYVPPYSALFKFLNLEARGANTIEESEHKCPVVTLSRKTTCTCTSRPSYAFIINNTCMVCKEAKNRLYVRKTFQAISHEHNTCVVKDKLCLNRLGNRHFVKECPSGQRCKKCHQSHHSWLHIEDKNNDCLRPTQIGLGLSLKSI